MHIDMGESQDESTCISRLSPDDYLLLQEDPMLWIQSNPAHCLSVRHLKVDYVWGGGKRITGDSIGELTELTHLSIHFVKIITYLPNILSSLRNLQKLDLEKCYRLQELPPNLGDLESLTSLSVSYCFSINSLPDSLAKLSKLTTLEIRSCDNLEELPANFGELESLTHFTLLDCRSIKSLPSSVAKLSKLTTLKIESCNNLQVLPPNMGELKSLTHLFIMSCESLKECPSNLNVLHLSLRECCSIQSLPRGLSNLKQLDLPLCINTEEERLANLKYFVSLRHLKFWDCFHKQYVKELPANFDKLPQLSLLDIQYTSIKCLPRSITKLSKLRLLLLPFDFILETLPYHLDESLVISVDDTHVRKTWKELKKEMEIFSFPTVREMIVDPSGYLPLTGDPGPWIQNNYSSHSLVRILDLELEDECTKNITDSIAKLAELTHLFITCGYLCQLPLTFTRITHISLYECEFECDNMESLCDSLGKLSTLESLHLDYLYNTELPEHMDRLVRLRHLSLRFSDLIMPLPDSMAKLSNLKTLHLSGVTQFDSLPENLNLEKLKLVNCNMTNIKSLPRGLRHVEILHTKGMCLPKCDKLGICLNQLVDVETLSVTCYNIKFLPSVAGLHNLQELQLKDCFSIKKLPPNLDKMVNLCTLNVSGTRIKSLPCSISKLPKLQCLILPKCFQPGSLPLKFRNQSIVSIDDTDDMYYKYMGYYNSNYETSSEVDGNTTNSIEGVNEVNSKESEEGIISQQQISPHQLLNQPDATPVLGDSHGNEGNYPIGENSHHTCCSYQNQVTEIFPFESEEWTANSRHSSQHALQHEQMASMTLEIEHGLPPIFQHDFSCGTGKNLLVSENGQNEDNLHREGDYAKGQEKKKEITRESIENLIPRNITLVAAANELKDYNFDGRDNYPINENSHHSIYHSRNQEVTFYFGESSQHDLQNVQMPKNMTWVNEEVSKESEEGIIGEQQTSPQQLLNLPDALPDSNSNGRNDLIGENSHHAISCSQNQEMELLSSGVCDEMITESSSNFQETVSFGKNSQHAVQNGQMDIINSETEHEITFLNQDISSYDERDVSHSGNSLHTLENKQIEKNSKSEGKKGKRQKEITLEDIQRLIAKGMTQVDAGIELGASRSTMKRRCRELGIEKWPSSRMLRHHCTNKKKVSSKSPSKSEYSQFNMVEHANPIGHEHVVECLDGENQHVLSKHIPSMYDAIDNSTPNATTKSVKESTVATQSHTDELAPECMNGTHLCTLSTTVQPNGSSSTFVVKANYNEDIVRFDFSLSSNIDQLKGEIGNRLELEVGKFKIRYQDDDRDWVLVTCISDLENALRLSKSAGSDVVRLSVISKT